MEATLRSISDSLKDTSKSIVQDQYSVRQGRPNTPKNSDSKVLSDLCRAQHLVDSASFTTPCSHAEMHTYRFLGKDYARIQNVRLGLGLINIVGVVTSLSEVKKSGGSGAFNLLSAGVY